MKKKVVLNIIIAIALATYLIYQIWDITQNSRRNSEFKPAFIRGAISHSEVLSSLDSITSNEIANCFYDKFVQRYGRDKLVELDNKVAAGDTTVYSIFAESIMDSCTVPFNQLVIEARFINTCINSFTKKQRPLAQRKVFCNCFMEKLKIKYGNNFSDSCPNDSILKINVLESGCVNELK